VYLVFAMWEERKDVMSWQSSLDVAGLQEEDKYKKNAQQYKFKHRGPMFQTRVPCEIRWTNIRSFGGTPFLFSFFGLGSRVCAGGVMLLMAGTCPYGSLMAMGACSKHGGQGSSGQDRTPLCRPYHRIWISIFVIVATVPINLVLFLTL
jgi:hypothetical protein